MDIFSDKIILFPLFALMMALSYQGGRARATARTWNFVNRRLTGAFLLRLS